MFSAKLRKCMTSLVGLSLTLALLLPTLWAAPVIALDQPIAPAGVPTVKVIADQTAAAQVLIDRYRVRINGVPMQTDPRRTQVDGVTYVSLRSMASALLPNARITWSDGAAAVFAPGVLTLTAVPGESYLVANGRYLYVPGTVLARNGSVLVPLDTLLKAMDAACVRLSDGSLSITTGSGGIRSGAQFYNETDLYWLSHIIHAESGNQPLAGKLAVGNVVLNRRADSRFPSTIKGVIFQKNQFSPAASGSVYKEPNEESVIAAKLCLDGAVSLENVLFFNRVGLKCWASKNRTFVATIAGHSFYA